MSFESYLVLLGLDFEATSVFFYSWAGREREKQYLVCTNDYKW